MSKKAPPAIGTITWTDLTVPDAAQVRKFYESVVGWKVEEVEMGGYSDYAVSSPTNGQTVAGICHARGCNAGLPPQWLIYINVADVKRAAARCKKLGGTILAGPRPLADGQVCIIKDPAGAVAALYSAGRDGPG